MSVMIRNIHECILGFVLAKCLNKGTTGVFMLDKRKFEITKIPENFRFIAFSTKKCVSARKLTSKRIFDVLLDQKIPKN